MLMRFHDRWPCKLCETEYIAFLEYLHAIDMLAACDPEPAEQRRRDFDAWLEQQV